jgi:hypothetical protein
MFKVMFLVCDMSVTLVACLVDCKPGKTPNRGQVISISFIVEREQWGPPYPQYAWLDTYWISWQCTLCQLISQHFPHYDVRLYFFCSTRKLRVVVNPANRPSPKNLESNLFFRPFFCFFLYTVKYRHFLFYQIWHGKGGFCKIRYYFLCSFALNVWKTVQWQNFFSASLSVCLPAFLSVCVCLSVCLCLCLSVSLFVCLSLYLSVCCIPRSKYFLLNFYWGIYTKIYEKQLVAYRYRAGRPWVRTQ